MVIATVLVMAVYGQGKSSVSTLKTFTAPGVSDSLLTSGYSEVTFGVKVMNVNTSVTFQFEGKMAGLDWGSLDADYDSTTVYSNKTIYRTYRFPASIDLVRVRFLSEAGGTAATPTCKIKLSNPFPR